MPTRTTCQSTTRQGRKCRNAALAKSNPPACWRHQAHPAARLMHRRRANPAATNHDSQSLASELSVVQQVLQRLVDRLDEPESAAEADDLRKVAALIFSGTRTVAYLLQQQSGRDERAPDWLDEALDVLAEDYGMEL